jgi:phage FluMu gp28-like protein
LVQETCATQEVQNSQEPRVESRESARGGRHATDALGPALQLLPYQRRWVEDDSPLKIAVKARQIGYSFAASIRALLECLKKKTTWIFLSKGERQSRLLMEKVQEHVQSCGILARACESAFFEGTLIKQLEVRFANGSVIYGLPANPDTARGYTGNVTLDEFAFHADADKIYSALFPTITRGYCLEVVSTPNGQQGKFYELAKAAGLVESGDREIGRSGEQRATGSAGSSVHRITRSPDHPIWSGHRVDIYEAIRQGLNIDLQLLRAGCNDETAWQQEYCCQFISTAENFIPPALVAQCTSAEAAKDCPPLVLASAPHHGLDSRLPELGMPGSEFYLGIDIGRHHDRTVFWVDEVQVSGSRLQVPEPQGQADGQVGRSADGKQSAYLPISPSAPDGLRVAVARLVRTFSDTPFAEQLAFARELLSLRRSAGFQPAQEAGRMPALLIRRACIDSTGMGAPLAESLEREFGARVEPVTFTAAVKEDMAYRVKRRMEQRLDLIPDAPEIARAFAAVKKLVTVAGNTRFDAERTDLGHADEFWAKALADLAAEQPVAHLSDGVIVGTPRPTVWLPQALPVEF